MREDRDPTAWEQQPDGWSFDDDGRGASGPGYNPDRRHEAWTGGDAPPPGGSVRRRGRGPKVFLLALLSLFLVGLMALGFSRLLSDLPDPPPLGSPSPGGTPQPDEPPPDARGPVETLFGTGDLPRLAIEDRPQSAIYSTQAGGLTIPEIAASVGPSVVGIVSESPYSLSYGSGIIISENGYIVTNAHVLNSGATITVVTDLPQEYAASVVGIDKKTDLAVLRVEADDLPAAVFGNSDQLVVGDLAVAIGNPMSMELFGSVTAGIISALDRKITLEDRTMTLLQTDAAINPGNSGGALVNAYGQVVGINSIKMISDNYEGIGFAIPSNSAMPIIEALITHGYVPGRPVVGIVGEDISAYYASYWNVPRGVYIHGTTEGTDAHGKGLKKGDIIIAINGLPIENMAQFNLEKDLHQTGETVTLTVYRNGQTFTVDILLTEAGPPA
ncbi:MAG: PDZ domain-containing protein [Clostridiales bacterium]|nr:PDZ domain-containing protein [Clostridiales bacterium]